VVYRSCHGAELGDVCVCERGRGRRPLATAPALRRHVPAGQQPHSALRFVVRGLGSSGLRGSGSRVYKVWV
jgi:hypothetical protein